MHRCACATSEASTPHTFTLPSRDSLKKQRGAKQIKQIDWFSKSEKTKLLILLNHRDDFRTYVKKSLRGASNQSD